jgi:hypothetical protein
VQEWLHDRIAVHARHVGVIGAGVFQGQPDELAASLQAGPVVKLVMHVHPM